MVNHKRLYAAAAIVIIAGVSLAVLYKTPVAQPPSASMAEFGGVSLSLEFATTTAGRERGLGGRTSLPVDYGMLFVFPTDDTYGFWMKDTLVPLDMFWLDAKGQVVYVAEDVQPASYPHVFYPPVPARYVLETSTGFAKAHDITKSSSLELQNFPTVSE